ncbi:MAG: 3-phosphoshikimate 1-carboxyvinyltransferase [Lachnospiraceae bacterium]|nr:3-phosphoshikimate 1-carboxyvinyltransferase [Lachnospiraceae bacterium]
MRSLKGEIKVPGDKSISHRAVMIGSLAKGTTNINGFLNGEDCLSTIDCMRKLGVLIDYSKDDPTSVSVKGNGLNSLKAPLDTLYTGNSGTTTRIISGLLSAQPFESTVDGDSSIRKRPMKRIIEPLTMMGAKVRSISDNGCAPLQISPSHLHGITYDSPVSSAQVKSAIILAALYASEKTIIIEPTRSRDHTELMLSSFGADILSEGNTVTVTPGNELLSHDITIPGDISSAAFFLVAGAITKNSEILIKDVNINPTRAGILTVLKDMGASLSISNERLLSGERTADLLIKSSDLHGTTISGDIIPALIDELPVIAVAAAYADGKTVIKDASELRVKESDRIVSISENLRAMGADVTETPDGMVINGGKPLHCAKISTKKDHRIAMAFHVASLPLDEMNILDDAECVNISYPGFFEDMKSLIH